MIVKQSRIIRVVFITALLTFSFSLIFISQASAADIDIVGKVTRAFATKAATWANVLHNYTLKLFGLFCVIEIAYFGIKAALNRITIGEALSNFVTLLLFSGFMLAVINNYQEWSNNIIDGLSKVAGELNGGEITDSPFMVGINLVNKVLDKLSVWSPGNSVALLIAALVIIVCFALITAQIVFIKCEAYITMSAGILLLGFGGSSFTKEYAINFMRYAFSVAFKLFVLQLLVGVGLSFILEFETSTANLEDIFVVIGASIVLLALVKSIPDVCAGIINGSHVSSGMSLTSTVAAVGGVAAGIVAGGAMAAGRGAMQVKDAANLASLEGKTGLGKAANMASTLWGNRQQAKSEIGMSSGNTGARSRELMKDRLERAKHPEKTNSGS